MFAVQCETTFIALKKEYGQRVDFLCSRNHQDKVESAKKLIDKDITIIVDTGEAWAKACVYTPPQAALIQANNKLYFREITIVHDTVSINTNFVQMAIDSLVSKKRPPQFNEWPPAPMDAVLDARRLCTTTPLIPNLRSAVPN